MKIVDILKGGRPTVSFEVFPPKRLPASLFGNAEEEAAMAKTKAVVRAIAATKPAFVSVTYGAAGGTTGANTSTIADYVQRDCGVTALAHLTCITSSRDKIADEIRDLREKGIENVLCLRGDFPSGDGRRESRGFEHAVDLVKALRPSTFCLGGACYPEGHPECEHLRDDIAHLKAKVDAGLDFLTTQMFFDNGVFYAYLAKIRSAGIGVPVFPGIMPVTNGRQIARICKLSGTVLPPRFRAIVDRFGESPEAISSAGVAYATEQIVDLFANGVGNVHVYTMNKPELAERIMRNLDGILG